MTQETQVPIKSEGQEEKTTDRDMQRQALRGLVQLSERCAADEAEIEQRHEGGVAAEAQAFERTNWSAEQNARGVEEEIEQKHQERLEKIKQQFATDTASIREANEKGKRKIQTEYSPQEQEIKKKYDEALWLADAELEARQNQIRLEQKKANEDLQTHVQEVDDLEGQAISLLSSYGHKPTDIDMSQMATPEGYKPEPGNFPVKRDAAAGALHDLHALFAPRLFVGARPVLILIVLLVIAGAITYLQKSSMDYNDYLITCGGTLAVAIVIGVVMKLLGKKGLRQVWARTKKHLDESRKAAKYDHENTLKELDARAEAARQKRATEAAALKDKYSPRLVAVQEKKKAALAANEKQTAARMDTYEQKRKSLVTETNQWRERHLEELKVKLAKQIESIRVKHVAREREIEERYRKEKAELEQRWSSGLDEVARPMQESGEANGRTVYNWEGTNWEKWSAPKSFTTLVRFGELQVDLKTITDQYPRQLALPEAFSVPANLAFPDQTEGVENPAKSRQLTIVLHLVPLMVCPRSIRATSALGRGGRPEHRWALTISWIEAGSSLK